MRITWINMDVSTDRRQFMESQLDKMGYQHHRFSAVTPETLPNIIDNPSKRISKKEYACLCSHLFAMKRCLQYEEEWFCIMEDDMVLNEDANLEDLVLCAPDDAEILQLFIINPNKVEQIYRKENRPIKWVKWFRDVYSTGIYLINRKGIEKILNSVLKEFVVDLRNINTLYSADLLLYELCNTYISTYPIAVPLIQLGSTIHPEHLTNHNIAINKISELTRGINYKDWKTLKIWFADFWPKFDPYNNFFTVLLKQNGIRFVIDQNDPDVLFYSVFGNSHINYKCSKIRYTGENKRPEWNDPQTVLNIGFDYTDEHEYFRLPLWFLYIIWKDDEDSKRIIDPMPLSLDWLDPQNKKNDNRDKFCCIVVGNGYCSARNQLFYELSKYKKVDSLGNWNNNVGKRIGETVIDKLEAMKEYKYTLCCENSSYPGYVTEKLLHAKMAGCIPIYWGDPLIKEDVNPKCFINVNDFDSVEKLIQHIDDIESGKIQETYSQEPFFTQDQINSSEKKLGQLVNRILNVTTRK